MPSRSSSVVVGTTGDGVTAACGGATGGTDAGGAVIAGAVLATGVVSVAGCVDGATVGNWFCRSETQPPAQRLDLVQQAAERDLERFQSLIELAIVIALPDGDGNEGDEQQKFHRAAPGGGAAAAIDARTRPRQATTVPRRP